MKLVSLSTIAKELSLSPPTLRQAFYQGTLPFKPTTMPGVQNLFVTEKQAQLIRLWQIDKKKYGGEQNRVFKLWYKAYKAKSTR